MASAHDMEHNETCGNGDCDSPTPADMPAIIIHGTWLCSPTCAKDHLTSSPRAPGRLTLHDPQFDVKPDSRPPGVSKNEVNMERLVHGHKDALKAITQMEEMYPGDFRVNADE
jgi:hypothetical protein